MFSDCFEWSGAQKWLHGRAWIQALSLLITKKSIHYCYCHFIGFLTCAMLKGEKNCKQAWINSRIA